MSLWASPLLHCHSHCHLKIHRHRCHHHEVGWQHGKEMKIRKRALKRWGHIDGTALYVVCKPSRWHHNILLSGALIICQQQDCTNHLTFCLHVHSMDDLTADRFLLSVFRFKIPKNQFRNKIIIPEPSIRADPGKKTYSLFPVWGTQSQPYKVPSHSLATMMHWKTQKQRKTQRVLL